MKIRLEHTEGETVSEFWIVGAPDLSPRQHSEAMAVQRSLARSALLDVTGASWVARRAYDRGNKGITLETTTNRTFATELECFDFVNSFSRADASAPHPMTGTVYLRCENHDDSWADEEMLGAVLAVIGVDQIGAVSVNIRYRITGGLLTDGGAGDYSWLYDSSGGRITDGDGRFIHDETHET
jgi:hypothetical protein